LDISNLSQPQAMGTFVFFHIWAFFHRLARGFLSTGRIGRWCSCAQKSCSPGICWQRFTTIFHSPQNFNVASRSWRKALLRVCNAEMYCFPRSRKSLSLCHLASLADIHRSWFPPSAWFWSLVQSRVYTWTPTKSPITSTVLLLRYHHWKNSIIWRSIKNAFIDVQSLRLRWQILAGSITARKKSIIMFTHEFPKPATHL